MEYSDQRGIVFRCNSIHEQNVWPRCSVILKRIFIINYFWGSDVSNQRGSNHFAIITRIFVLFSSVHPFLKLSARTNHLKIIAKFLIFVFISLCINIYFINIETIRSVLTNNGCRIITGSCIHSDKQNGLCSTLSPLSCMCTILQSMLKVYMRGKVATFDSKNGYW